jgi:hypothetical protein
VCKMKSYTTTINVEVYKMKMQKCKMTD